MATKLTDEINSWLIIGDAGGTTVSKLQSAILALNNGALTVNDTVTGKIADIKALAVTGMYEADAATVSDEPPGSTGKLYILATLTESNDWTYRVIDELAIEYIGHQPAANADITWGPQAGDLQSDGTVLMEALYEPQVNQAVATLKTVLDNAPASGTPTGYITRIVESGVDAVSAPYSISLPFIGRPSRVIRLAANIQAKSMQSGNGQVKFNLATKDQGGVIEQTLTKTKGIFEMMDPAEDRDYHVYIDFEKGASGSLDVDIQFTGALGVISSSEVELIVMDIGEMETPTTVPTIISTTVENINRGQVKLITSRNMQSTAFDGWTVPGKTISNITYEQTNVFLWIFPDFIYSDTVQAVYDQGAAGSDFRAIDDDEELASGTFNGNNFINQPPVVSGPVNLGILLQADSPKNYTTAELLVTATDPEGAGLSVNNISVATGPGSIVDNLDGTFTFTEAGTGAVVLNYDAFDGEYNVPVVANIDVQTAVTTEMNINSWQINTARRIDFIMDENLDATQPTTEQSAIPGFEITGGYTIDRIKQNNLGSEILNMYLNQDIAVGVSFTLTYTKANLVAGERVIGQSGNDFPDGPIVLTKP